MPQNLSLYVLLILAIGAGFILGKRDKHKRDRNPDFIPKHYLSGLTFLLNEQVDKAIQIFVKTIVISDETLDTHLALGNSVRRQGEIDRAIRLHQNLLARPGLSVKKRALIEIELARDYLSAGLLDRAERILQGLAQNSTRFGHTARLLLLDIYERESDWQAAIDTAKFLLKKKLFGRDGLGEEPTARVRIRTALGHYYCEQAELTREIPDVSQTRELLAHAIAVDPDNARVSLACADLEMSEQQFERAKSYLEQVATQNFSLIPESLALYQSICHSLNAEHEYYSYLEKCLTLTSHIDVLTEYARLMHKRLGAKAARDFVLENLGTQPSVAGLRLLFEFFDAQTGDEPFDVSAIREFLGQEHPAQSFRCQNCGFSLKQLLWFCPSCKLWGEISRMP